MKSGQKRPSALSHPIPPVYDEHSRVLILGSFPSVRSRESGFFYGHKQNRFWRVLSALFDQETPRTNEEKRAFLLKNRIALWDVIASCEIVGSSDASIAHALPNDLRPIFEKARLEKVFVNGRTAEKLYREHIEGSLGIPAVCLPSTSAANASYGMERLIEAWRAVSEAVLGSEEERNGHQNEDIGKEEEQ